MATETKALRSVKIHVSQARQRLMGIFLLAIAVGIWLIFTRSLEPGVITTFGLTPGGSTVRLPNWAFNTRLALNLLAFASATLGAYQLVRGFGAYASLILILVSGFFIFSFLAWAAAGASLNLVGLLQSTLIKAVPLTLGAFSGVLSERAGVVNIAIEGMMLMGAMVGALVGSVSNLWIALISAIAAGGLLGLVHGILSIKYKTDRHDFFHFCQVLAEVPGS
jgi:simple sugar transport system permease protein